LPALRPHTDQCSGSCDPRACSQSGIKLILEPWPASRSENQQAASRSNSDKASYAFWYKELNEFRQEYRLQCHDIREDIHQLFAIVTELKQLLSCCCCTNGCEKSNTSCPYKESTTANSPPTPQAMEDWDTRFNSEK
ncbi:hypothetical protein N5P37_011453, partial [Trichoderma harzianum]